MAAPSVTHTFANSTVADATQVNTNFNDLVAGMSDGTKDFSINALTCAGAAILGAAVTLGTSLSNDITVNGSIASTLTPKTDGLYDLGTSAKGFRSLYLGDGSGDTASIVAPALAADIVLTLPAATGTFATLAGTETLTGKTYSGVIVTRVSKAFADTPYTCLTTDVVVEVDASGGAVTVIPLTAAGRKVLIKKTDSSANRVTVQGTIDGATNMLLSVQNEAVEVTGDGTNLKVTGYVPITGTYTPATGAGGTTNFGTLTYYVAQYIKVRDYVTVWGKLDADPTAVTNTLWRITIPIASNFAATTDLNGHGNNSGGDTRLFIEADTTNDNAYFNMSPVASSNENIFFCFTYKVI